MPLSEEAIGYCVGIFVLVSLLAIGVVLHFQDKYSKQEEAEKNQPPQPAATETAEPLALQDAA